MPATGAIARTAVNVRSGARTRVAAIVHSPLLPGSFTWPPARCPRSCCPPWLGAGGRPSDDLAEDGALASLDEIRCRHVRPDSRRHCLLRPDRGREIGTCSLRSSSGVVATPQQRRAGRSYQGRISPATNELPCYALTEPCSSVRAERISNAITGADRPEVSVVIIRCRAVGMPTRRCAHPCRDRENSKNVESW